MCDEIINTTKRILTKTVPKKSNSKKFYIFLYFSYHSGINCCYYLLLLNKISNKQKKNKLLLPYHILTDELKHVVFRWLSLIIDIINVKNFDPNEIKIDEREYKNIVIYYIGYATIKYCKYVKFNRVNPLNLVLGKVNGKLEK